MGMINCSVCNTNVDNTEEIKSESNIKTTDYSYLDSFKYNTTNSTNLGIDVLNSPFSDYSFALFERFNSLRTEPLKFYSESNKYNLSYIIEELINKKDKTLGLTWSSKKERIINNIMQNNGTQNFGEKLEQIKRVFVKEFDIKIFYSQGNFSRIDDALWNVLNCVRNNSEDKLRNLLMNKIDFCVIYSMNAENINLESNNNFWDTKRKIIENKSIKVVSFFFLFYYK